MAIVHLACGFFVPAIVVRHWASKMPCGRSASYTNTRRQGSTKLDTYVREAWHVTFSLFACRWVTLSLELSTCQLVSVVHAKRFLSSKPAMPGSLYQ